MNDTIGCDLRHQFGAVRDQGARPTCLIFAVSDAHAAARDGWAELSCEYLFFHAQRRAGRQVHEGALLAPVLAALCEEGQPLEQAWPYQKTSPSAQDWRPPADAWTLFRRNGIIGQPAVDRILAHLDAGQPVVLLLEISDAFFKASAGVPVDYLLSEDGDRSRRHAVIAVGHGFIHGRRCILIRNSWGAGWGMEGHGWLTEAYVAKRAFALSTLRR